MPLYPHLEPFRQFRMKVSPIHELHVEQCGNPDGRPVVLLHGGPGGGCSPVMRQFFDPEQWHMVLFDQRGAGDSTPYGETRENTLADLLQDMERIRSELGIERWTLFGGSWGSTLALHYGLAFPDRVDAMVLRGIFLARPEDLAWLYGADGAARLKPDAWEDFVEDLGEHERNDPLAAYHERLRASSMNEAFASARKWARWEAVCATLLPNPDVEKGFDDSAWPIARMETHYFAGGGMGGASPILPRMAALADVPAILVHGRYDLVCPPDQAWALHCSWPGSELRWVEAAGHTVREPAVADALVQATDDIRKRLGAQ